MGGWAFPPCFSLHRDVFVRVPFSVIFGVTTRRAAMHGIGGYIIHAEKEEDGGRGVLDAVGSRRLGVCSEYSLQYLGLGLERRYNMFSHWLFFMDHGPWYSRLPS